VEGKLRGVPVGSIPSRHITPAGMGIGPVGHDLPAAGKDRGDGEGVEPPAPSPGVYSHLGGGHPGQRQAGTRTW